MVLGSEFRVFTACFCLYPIPQWELGAKGERLWWSTNRFRRRQVLAKPDTGSEIEREAPYTSYRVSKSSISEVRSSFPAQNSPVPIFYPLTNEFWCPGSISSSLKREFRASSVVRTLGFETGDAWASKKTDFQEKNRGKERGRRRGKEKGKESKETGRRRKKRNRNTL